MSDSPVPVLPDYGGGCIDSVVPALRGSRPDAVLPVAVPADASQVVLLVLDGLGWHQLQERATLAPTMSAMAGGPITSVVPTTTAVALTSITTGLSPAGHGVVGYRVRVAGTSPSGDDEVLNLLRWRTASGDARSSVDPVRFQSRPAFGGDPVPAVTKAEFAGTGFTSAHLAGARLVGWRMPSTLVAEVRRLLVAGERFVYAYYDGIDRVAHEYGLDDRYDAEVVAADRLVGDLASLLPPGAALAVTSDHGQVQVGGNIVGIDPGLMAQVWMLSGEGRFRWLHTRSDPEQLCAEALDLYRDQAWVMTRDEVEELGWFGGPLSDVARGRLGDVVIVPHAPVAFLDPADTGEVRLVSRHGSLTEAEMHVPLLVVAR
jgi:predicted AlkP superfamily pyrophosphatase or phosphodiesterase